MGNGNPPNHENKRGLKVNNMREAEVSSCLIPSNATPLIVGKSAFLRSTHL